METCFTINLGILSSVLCGWKSLGATIRDRLKPRTKSFKSRTLDHHRTPDPRGTLIDKSYPIFSRRTLKPKPASFSARHFTLILQQNKNKILYIKRWAAQTQTKPISQNSLLDTHHTPERRDLYPTTRTVTQVPLTRKL